MIFKMLVSDEHVLHLLYIAFTEHHIPLRSHVVCVPSLYA